MATFMQTMFVPPHSPSIISNSLSSTSSTCASSVASASTSISSISSEQSTNSKSPQRQQNHQYHYYPPIAKPLSPLHSNVLASSFSSVVGDRSRGGSPAVNGTEDDIYSAGSPLKICENLLQRHFRDVLQTSASSNSLYSDFTIHTKNLQKTETMPDLTKIDRPVTASPLSSSPTKRERSPCLPRSKAGRQQRQIKSQQATRDQRNAYGDRQLQDGLGYGLENITLQADLLTNDVNRNANTRARGAFKPQRTQKSNSWQLKQFADATLGDGSLKKVVKLPEGEDRDEWIAVNVVDFYNQINLLYGSITEFCTPQTCPEMKATSEFEYLWHNPPEFPKPTKTSAPAYISNLLTWTSGLLSNTELFPTEPGVPFPDTFYPTIRQIFKRLYRVFAHMYCHHYEIVKLLQLEPHLNTAFKHYILFVEEFGLADQGEARREWFGPLGELVEQIISTS